MKSLIFIQNDGNKINNNSLETVVGIQKNSKENDEILLVAFNKEIAQQLQKYHCKTIILVNNE